jgi:hypothetical protein
MFGRAGIPLDGIRAVVEPTRRVLDAARKAGILVVYLAMEFKADLSHLGTASAPNRTRHLAMGVGNRSTPPTAALAGSSSATHGTRRSSRN